MSFPLKNQGDCCSWSAHHELVPGTQVNKDFLNVLNCESVSKVLELRKKNSWLLHDDNAQLHEVLIVTNLENKNATNNIG